jgi:hypothetical protein
MSEKKLFSKVQTKNKQRENSEFSSHFQNQYITIPRLFGIKCLNLKPPNAHFTLFGFWTEPPQRPDYNQCIQ